MKPGDELASSEAVETLRAIRVGEVDGFVVSEGGSERVVLLEGALRPYHDLVERMHQGAAILARSGEIEYANARLAAMVGRSPRDLVGVRIVDLVHASCRAVCERAVERADQRPAALEVELVGPGASELVVVLSVSAMPASATLCAVVTDLTERQTRARLERELAERRRAEAALRESEARFRTMAETVPGILFACDASGALQYCNARFTEYTGVPPRPGGSSWLDVAHWDDRIRCRPLWDRALAEHTPFEARCRLRTADGRFRGFQVRARAIPGEGGAVVQWFGVGTDVDELVRAEQALVDADRRKDRFLMTLAHELRSPLAPIGSAVRFLDRVGSAPEAVAAREAIKRQVGHLVRIVDALLDLSRIRWGGAPLRTARCELGQLVRSTAEEHRRLLASNGLTLAVDVPGEPCWVVADAARLAQVLRNLLHNANKFTGHGGAVRVSLRDDREREEAVVVVSDTGVGVAPDLLTRIFDPFVQGGGPAPEGLGFGLALVKGIVGLHGGTVTAESRGRGHGTSVVIRLPLGGARAALPVGGASDLEREPRRRVLLVEDDADAARVLEALLLLDGHHVEVCSTPESALRAVDHLRPEVVLCDLGLRGALDACALARALRAVPELPPFLLVALTRAGEDQDLKRAFEAGFDRHLAGPVDHGSLSALLRSWQAPEA